MFLFLKLMCAHKETRENRVKLWRSVALSDDTKRLLPDVISF